VEAWKQLGPIKLVPKSQIDFNFYPDWVEVPTKINNPVHGPTFLKKGSWGVSGFDFNHFIFGNRFFHNLSSASVVLDGKSDDIVLQAPGPENFRWWSLTGPTGSVLVAVHNDPRLDQEGIQPVLVLKESVETPEPPESEAGGIFIGFDLPYHLLPKGKYAIGVKQVYPVNFQAGKEEEYLRASRINIVTEARPLK
jgi:hypothetical protein